jgi:hypothetical protein
MFLDFLLPGNQVDVEVVVAKGGLDILELELLANRTSVRLQRNAELIKILSGVGVNKTCPGLVSGNIRDPSPVAGTAFSAISSVVS